MIYTSIYNLFTYSYTSFYYMLYSNDVGVSVYPPATVVFILIIEYIHKIDRYNKKMAESGEDKKLIKLISITPNEKTLF